jgi:alpha-tubulin suppressor-like RCC1 family protein
LGTPATEGCVQPGLVETPCSPVPAEVSGDHRFSMVATGVSHACGITLSGETYCWGTNAFGQLGDGLLGDPSNVPVQVIGGLTFASVSVGDNHSCGETTDGKLYCWGANDRGQLGTGNRNIGLGPLAVVDAVGPS